MQPGPLLEFQTIEALVESVIEIRQDKLLSAVTN